jgi:putative transposase
MSDYRRAYEQGGCYFFTLVTCNRQPILTESANLQRLDESFAHVAAKRPFATDAIVVLPDHLHCIWQLPEGDADFSSRWRLIKGHFSIALDAPLTGRSEKRVWQRRFWEHLIRDEDDWRRHVDYIHYNPVKHGYVLRPMGWDHSSFRRMVELGLYPPDWGCREPDNLKGMNLE